MRGIEIANAKNAKSIQGYSIYCMAIHFQGVTFPPLNQFTASAPDGAIIGIIGLKGSGKSALLHLAAGLAEPASGTVTAPSDRRLIRLGEPLNFSPTGLLALDAALSCQDALVRERACISLERVRRAGSTILFASPDESMLRRLADEIWWLDKGQLTGKAIRAKFIAATTRSWQTNSRRGALRCRNRSMSGRAGAMGALTLVSLETGGADGQPSQVLRSHRPATVRVGVRFAAPVENPVIGILIRTRIGLEVYGTNTELEGIRIGPCTTGQEVHLTFKFDCDLCPGDYTLTAASHDPSGTAHDWLDDAVAFSVAADRYTAGVADLRASVTIG